jgi:hypothetical protein
VYAWHPGFSGVAQELLHYDRQGIGGNKWPAFRFDLEKRSTDGIPNLAELESGKLLGAILPMSEQAQLQLRDSIEVIDYLMNQEGVVWS